MNLREQIDAGNCSIVLDTNILMRLYDFSPEFSTFALRCLSQVYENIIIPYTVKIEFLNHFRGCFARMQHRIENYDKKVTESINAFELNMSQRLKEIKNLHFPDVDKLENEISDGIKSLRGYLDDYLDEHGFLEILNKEWIEKDFVYKFFDQIITTNKIMESISPENIYKICEEGRKRYKDSIPPGFKDAKSKDGVRKYSDLILWKEVINYAATNKKDIIFITDDLKVDWWEKKDKPTIFHPYLINEFEKNTQQKLTAYSSFEFYEVISKEYLIQKSDAVDLALGKTMKDYAEAISEKVFDYIFADLVYSGEEFLDEETSYLGSSEEIELDDDVEEYELLSTELIDRDENEITYNFKYRITIRGKSYDYLGRDDDNKEVILSPANNHTFRGSIEVEVIRNIDIFADLAEDNSFSIARIIGGNLEQIEFEAYNSDGDYDDAENYCPDCGKPMTIENDAGTGFCTKCSPNH